MKIIDAHHHFWQYHPDRDSWITNEMHVLKYDFMPIDFAKIIQENQIHGSILVQSDQTEEANDFLLKSANEFDFIKGVVGWVDLNHPEIETILIEYKQNIKLKGFRHILQSEKKGFMLKPSFLNGVQKLGKYGFTYDILIYPHQLEEAVELVKQFPETVFILDHMAKPNIKNQEIEDWKKNIIAISKYKNVNCKISGIVTEAEWFNWNFDQLKPYIDIVIENFTVDNIMFGSDWPVCLLSSTYEKWLNFIKLYFSNFSTESKEKFFSINCSRIYNL